MSQNPLDHPCPHLATPEEQNRDPDYLFCHANPGQPCHWARRYDGTSTPAFHSERLEMTLSPGPEINREAFDRTILDTGLI